MSIFSFGRKKQRFDRNYYGELCQMARQKSILENTVAELAKERDDLVKRLRRYEEVEPKTKVDMPPDGEVWVVTRAFEDDGSTPPIRIEEAVAEPAEEVVDTHQYDEFDVVYDADGKIIHEKNKDSTRKTVTPITAIPPSANSDAAGCL